MSLAIPSYSSPASRAAGSPVAIVGFGTVGQAVARALAADYRGALRVTTVCNRDVERKRARWVAGDVTWTEDFGEVLASDAAVVVEAIGGVDPAERWVRAALGAGKSVVTANKQLVARAGPELDELARVHGVGFRFEAAVGGGVPVIGALRNGLAGDCVIAVAGVLNGTSNAILTRMADERATFDEALADAKRRGFAEADPSDDISGRDAAAKLSILVALAFGRRVSADSIGCRSIAGIERPDFEHARRRGCTIRQVSLAEPTPAGVRAFVGPALVPVGSDIARARGAENVVGVRGLRTGLVVFRGPGAGGAATASAIVSDLLEIGAGERPPRRAAFPPLTPARRVEGDVCARWYVRADSCGVVVTERRLGSDVDRTVPASAVKLPIFTQDDLGGL